MILTFSQQTFATAIIAGYKLYTLRRDAPQRWRPGMRIHFWCGNPRNRGSFPFSGQVVEAIRDGRIPGGVVVLSERPSLPVCTGVQEIEIRRMPRLPGRGMSDPGLRVSVDGRRLTGRQINELAQRDGLSTPAFRQWFVPDYEHPFRGRIIHWSNLRV